MSIILPPSSWETTIDRSLLDAPYRLMTSGLMCYYPLWAPETGPDNGAYAWCRDSVVEGGMMLPYEQGSSTHDWLPFGGASRPGASGGGWRQGNSYGGRWINNANCQNHTYLFHLWIDGSDYDETDSADDSYFMTIGNGGSMISISTNPAAGFSRTPTPLDGAFHVTNHHATKSTAAYFNKVLPTDQPLTLIVTMPTNHQNDRAWVNGEEIQNESSASLGVQSSITDANLYQQLANKTDGLTMSMDYSHWQLFMSWDRILSDAEILELSRDPFVLFRKSRNRSVFSLTPEGPPTFFPEVLVNKTRIYKELQADGKPIYVIADALNMSTDVLAKKISNGVLNSTEVAELELQTSQATGYFSR